MRRAAKKTLGTIRCVMWTDHANLTRAQVGDVDVKLLRWVSELVSDGSEIRSLGGRSAKLGDGFSRNPPGRDELLAQRTRDLKGLTGQLRGFDLAQFLGEDTGSTGPVPWVLGDDAVPDKPGQERQLHYLDRIAVTEGLAPQVMVLLVHDYCNTKHAMDASEEVRVAL